MTMTMTMTKVALAKKREASCIFSKLSIIPRFNRFWLDEEQ